MAPAQALAVDRKIKLSQQSASYFYHRFANLPDGDPATAYCGLYEGCAY